MASKVMPLGDSITYGYGDPNTTVTGRRLELGGGNAQSIDFVGSPAFGKLRRTDNEGYPGIGISALQPADAESFPDIYQPQIICCYWDQ